MTHFMHCKKDGTAKHYGDSLWTCTKPTCQHVQPFGSTFFCKFPLMDAIMEKRKNEEKMPKRP